MKKMKNPLYHSGKHPQGRKYSKGLPLQRGETFKLNDIEPRRSAVALHLPLGFSDQLGKRRAKRSRQRVPHFNSGLAQAPLDEPYIGAMDARLVRQRLLRQASGAAVTLHHFAERVGQGFPSHGGLET